MRQFSFFHPAALGLVAAFLAAGCSSFEPARARREHTASFTTNLARLAEGELAKPLSLDDCILIAMTNNYEVRKADLEREMYRIGRNVAFTAFLPKVAASAGYNSYSRDPEITEKQFGSADLDITMPIFMPSTWFLYAAARHGYAASGAAAHYVRQGIVLQTSVNYYNVLVQSEIVEALQSQMEATRKTAERVQGLAREGLVTAWEGDQALFAAELREAELNSARRRMILLRGELLKGLGLSPAAEIELSGETGEIPMPAGKVEDMVLKALEIHPELAIADRMVVIHDNQVRRAFCDFLPTISLFSSGQWTGNDLAAQSANWVSGFGAVWTLFDGLANVARYNAAKLERRQTSLERENTFLSIMVEVVAAEAAARDASESARIRQRAYEVAAAKFADYDAKAREGLIPLSDALDARAVMDFTQVELLQSRYQERIAIAGLNLAMGITIVSPEKDQTKTEK